MGGGGDRAGVTQACGPHGHGRGVMAVQGAGSRGTSGESNYVEVKAKGTTSNKGKCNN